MPLNHRLAAVAGQFYPLAPDQLSFDINHFLNEVPSNDSPTNEFKAIIVPHAGYIYSGSVAARAYNPLKKRADTISNIILLGPAHRVAFNGIATSSAAFFDTPLGSIPINRKLIDTIEQSSFVNCNDEAHQNEHSLEVQLPFLQTILQEFTLVPLVVGNCDSNDVASIIEQLWGNKETLIVISSDLSHFNNYEVATKIDNSTSQAILDLQYEKIDFENACGRIPVNGLLKVAKKKQLKTSILDVKNSGDTAGDKNRVVGYGAFTFTE